MTMNALDTALTRLAAASTALEYTAKPGLKDVENAKKEAKAAAEILDAAHKLMGYGVYTVAQEPAAPGVALFDEKGQPAVPTETTLAPEPSALSQIQSFQDLEDTEQEALFQEKLDELATATPDVLEDEPWETLFEQDRLLAFKSVLFCLAADPKEFLPPGQAAVQIWLAKLQPELPELPDLLGDFQALHPAMRDKRWNEAMDALFEKVDVNPESDWDAPWEHAYSEDPVQAFAHLQFALQHRQPASVAYPSDEEMATWTAQFAPAAPQFDAAEFFASKLKELEEAGLADGQKLKDWKKTEKAWKAEFKADPDTATNKLLWRLQQVSVVWGVPSNEEVA